MRRFALLLILLNLPAAAAGAETGLTLVLGYRGGDASFPIEADAGGIACLVPPCVVAEASTPESAVLGLVLDVPISQRWMFEARLDRQEADLRQATALPLEAGPLTPQSFELTTLEAGVLRRWPGDGLAPFVAAGVGIAGIETPAAVLSASWAPGETGRRLGSRDGMAFSLGGGALKELGRSSGLRFEVRGLWVDLPRELGGELVQIEVAAGLTLRLGG